MGVGLIYLTLLRTKSGELEFAVESLIPVGDKVFSI